MLNIEVGSLTGLQFPKVIQLKCFTMQNGVHWQCNEYCKMNKNDKSPQGYLQFVFLNHFIL